MASSAVNLFAVYKYRQSEKDQDAVWKKVKVTHNKLF